VLRRAKREVKKEVLLSPTVAGEVELEVERRLDLSEIESGVENSHAVKVRKSSERVRCSSIARRGSDCVL